MKLDQIDRLGVPHRDRLARWARYARSESGDDEGVIRYAGVHYTHAADFRCARHGDHEIQQTVAIVC